MKKLTAIILLLACVTFSHAQWGKGIKGNGNEVTIERETGDYEGVSIGGFFSAELVEGTEGTITVTGEDNILENVETEVVNGTLVIKIKDNKQLRPSSGKTIFISIPVEQIDAVRLSGSGKVVGNLKLKSNTFKVHSSGSRKGEFNIETKKLILVTSGSSHLELSGESEELDITSSGSSHLKGYGLQTDNLSVQSSGSSNIRITVNTSINVRSSGSSNIKYRGNPEKVSSKASGSSKVSKEQ